MFLHFLIDLIIIRKYLKVRSGLRDLPTNKHACIFHMLFSPFHHDNNNEYRFYVFFETGNEDKQLDLDLNVQSTYFIAEFH